MWKPLKSVPPGVLTAVSHPNNAPAIFQALQQSLSPTLLQTGALSLLLRFLGKGRVDGGVCAGQGWTRKTSLASEAELAGMRLWAWV